MDLMYRPDVTHDELRVSAFCPFCGELTSWIVNCVVMQLVSEGSGKEHCYIIMLNFKSCMDLIK